MTDLLLIRHGESEWNAAGRWQGRADPPLTDLGRLQAAHAARALGAVDALVASPLVRAHETASIIANELGIGPVEIEPALVERDAGAWSGMTRPEIEVEWPGYLADGRRPPGYEDDHSFLARTRGALERIVARSACETVIVVCHGGVIYATEGWLGAEFERIPNLGSRWVHWSDGTPHLGDRVILVDPDELTAQAPDIL